MSYNVEKLAANFALGSKIVAITECNIGHINGTYFVDTENNRFVLQKINQNVFKRPEQVMANIVAVTKHIKKKIKAEKDEGNGCTLDFLRSGRNYYFYDEDGEYWRCYTFVDGKCHQACESTEIMTEVGRTFGNFQRLLADFDASALYETIKDFHNTVKRFEAFERTVEADPVGRVANVAAEIEFVRARRDICNLIVDGIKEGKYPIRVTHNDTKLNNVVMDKETGKGRCVLDLDTVMPGSLLYDFGDAIRFCASSAPEDETDLSKVYVKTEIFEAYAKGFIEGIGTNISEAELDAFPDAAKIITFETGMRFLTDYIDGDNYFRTGYPEHNLDRARNQLKLVADMETKEAEFKRIIENLK
ncbi:MAG: aminoglycoside phosphotransferase family protein [Ruminococcaceae bacterium]|nr:aminoglycoside phosphotransferase family protein [Oscillospiraceae bacterium]